MSLLNLKNLGSLVIGGGGGGGFSPLNISGLALWLNAGAGVYSDAGITPAVNNGNVRQWNDQSGNGRNVTQTTLAIQPFYLSNGGPSSLPTIDFRAASNTLFQVPNFLTTLTNGAEIFVVMKQNVDPTTILGTAGYWNLTGAGTTSHVPWIDGVVYDGFGSTTRQIVGDPATSLANWCVYNVVSVAGEWTDFLNGTQLFTTGTNTVGWNTNGELGGAAAVIAWYDGRFAEIIMYNNKLSDANKTLVKGYITAKYGITQA